MTTPTFNMFLIIEHTGDVLYIPANASTVPTLPQTKLATVKIENNMAVKPAVAFRAFLGMNVS
jgi:hypothetical protein